MRQRCTTYEQIKAEYPKIFPPDFHCDIGPGWITLIDALCCTIQNYVDNIHFRLEEGASVPENIQPVAAQVKEKFGGLRFYVDGGDRVTDGMIALVETLSTSVCEDCGHPGTRRSGGWIRTLCDEHHNAWIEARKAQEARYEETRKRLAAEAEERKRQEEK
jgi:hypothetical protein